MASEGAQKTKKKKQKTKINEGKAMQKRHSKTQKHLNISSNNNKINDKHNHCFNYASNGASNSNNNNRGEDSLNNYKELGSNELTTST